MSTLNRPVAPGDIAASASEPKGIPASSASSAARAAPVDLEAEADLDRCGALKDFWYVACTSLQLAGRHPVGRSVRASTGR